MTFLLIDFKLDQKTQIRKYRWSEVPRIYAICVSIEHVHMHTYTYAHTHTLFARVYTRSGYSSVRPLRSPVYESSCVYMYAQIGVSRRHGRLCCAGCVQRCVYIHERMCVCRFTGCACHPSAVSPSVLSRGGRVLNFHPLFNRRLRSRLH